MSLIISLILGVEMKLSSGWDFLGETKIYQLVDSPLRGYDEGKWRDIRKRIRFGMCLEALDNATQSYGSPLLPVFIGPNDLLSIMI